jgi:hypothetical protein
MICSSTPFITGRPFTMFFNDRVYSEGAVGVAISDISHSFSVDFPANLQPITPELTVTRCVSHTADPSSPSRFCSRSCEGNLINSLDNLNPTRMLLEVIEAAGIHNVKEDDFYLALVQGGHVRVDFLSITVLSVDLSSSEEARFPHHFRGPKQGYYFSRVARRTI